MFGALNIKGTILDKKQLENYMERLASDHVLKNKSDRETYPIPKLEQNFIFIEKVYNLLNEHLKIGINIHPAGEWLLDNFYIIDETVKTIKKELTISKYCDFLGIANGVYKGYARIYVLAAEMVAYTESNINEENIMYILRAYQKKKSLSMNEIWNIGLFIKITIIENIANVCEKIYSSQMQKYRAENIIERLIDNKERNNLIYKVDNSSETKKLGYGEMKYPFIEYMSYRLKMEGKKTIAFLNVLEQEVEKMGTSVSEIIKKEHFDIALRKVMIGNCITSIKRLSRINFLEIFESINGVEEILKQDPAGIYNNMDSKTKDLYRNKIKEISKKTKISEIYIAKKLIELSNENIGDDRKSHIGYYLLSDEIEDLYKKLGIKKRQINNENKFKIYKYGIMIITIIITILIMSLINKANLIVFALLLVPISEICIKIIQYILSRVVKPKVIPKLDLYNGIPKEYSTMVIIPTILNSKEKVKELIRKLEIYYIANKSDNIYFTLLGDCTSSIKEKEDIDIEIIETGKYQIEKLNNKYGKDIFNFLYRKRIWNSGEERYLGRERKRGLINQFNDFLINKNENDFIANTFKDVPKIKYIITLDADTNLILNSAFELIGAMAHILNKPILDEENNIVIEGYGIIQPKVGINLDSTRKTIFTKLYAGSGGTDFYTNAISDVYQDNFGEGIFTGKGIYDLHIFDKVLRNEIPDNTVLSHDLLEGNYLRCGLASDILVMDDYPCKYNSSSVRSERWIRGDFQIFRWITNKTKNINNDLKKNPLNSLSKFKIFDNLRREILPIIAVILIFTGIFLKISSLITISIIAITISMILEILNRILFRRSAESANKSFTPSIRGIKASIIRLILEICFLPDKAYVASCAILKTIYRMNISKKHLLEWITSEDAENASKTDYKTYLGKMFFSIIIGVITITIGYFRKNPLIILGLLWIFAPIIACFISKEKKSVKKIEELTQKEKDYVLDIGKKTWNYFKETMIPANNYLPPDNYQENRGQKFVYRTSSTNIGLGLLSIISSYDLGYENLDDTINLIKNVLDTIDKLSKWNGHLYNWYNIETLEPLIPRYISTVDSGNFIGYLYVVKQFLSSIETKQEEIKIYINRIDNIIKNTDFKYLYDEKARLFSIGFNVEENKLTDSYYDLLASEARQASIVAIAKKDVTSKHWANLSRTLTTLDKYKGLISWSGTAFEYLMPNINIKNYEGSLLDESCKFLVMSQKKYSSKLGIPWGMSEAAFNIKDLNANYQYKAFGIPWLGLKRGLADEVVIASYASMLWIPEDPKEVIKNINRLDDIGIMGKYGLYESVDYTVSRLKYKQKYEIVKTFMAHHQALILLSINNLFNDYILQKRFDENSEIKAVDILLQERLPENIIITKEKKEKPEKLKYNYESYSERVYKKIDEITRCNVISNEDYTIVMNQKGDSYSKYKDIYINRFKETRDINQGIIFFIKDIKNKRIWSTNYLDYMPKTDSYEIHFTHDGNKIQRKDGNIETNLKITVHPDLPIEIRTLELKNIGNQDEILEVSSFFEPIISNKDQDISHMAFNDLFIRYDYNEKNNSLVLERRDRQEQGNKIFMGVSFYTEDETMGDIEYEIDKEKFFGKGNLGIPEMVETSKPMSKQIGLVVTPIVAMKRVMKVKANSKIEISLIITISDNINDINQNLEKYNNNENIKKVFELSKIKSDEEARYLGIKGRDIEEYQDIASLILFQNPFRKYYLNNMLDRTYKQSELWKFGISGDYPIILVKIRDLNDSYIIDDIIKAYEFLRIKNIYSELVIMDEERHSYDQYVRECIENSILNRHLAYLKNVRTGIFVINEKEISKEDKDLLTFRANLIIDSHLGNIKSQLEELEERYLKNRKNIGNQEYKEILLENETIRSNKLDKKDKIENLKYYNEYGAFSNNGKEYIIKINKDANLPCVWSHVLTNEKFGTIVTEGLGGYTWKNNSKLNRISSWCNDQCNDIPSEIIFLQDMENGKSWSLGARPMPDNNDYFVTYGFGYAKYEHFALELSQKLELFVPLNDNIKIGKLDLKNTSAKKRKIRLIYYMKPVIGEDEIKTNGYIKVKKENNIIIAENKYGEDCNNKYVYVSSSENIDSFTGNKQSFLGNSGITNPDSLRKVSLDNQNGVGADSCIAFEINLDFEPFENKEISIFLGEEEDMIDVKNISYKYSNISNCRQELGKTKKYWFEKIDRLQISTPLESMNILLNGWAQYQIICSRLWGRTGYFQSGGAFGFRDQLQDTLGLKFIDIDILKNQIIKHSKHQFLEGDVEHWWHEDIKKGIRTKFSDDLLWLVYCTIEYIEFTKDYSILEITTPYLKGEKLEDDVIEKYDSYEESEVEESIYHHCLRAIERSLIFGENGLPKIGSGDWNDGFSNVGPKGKGESVWLGFFLYDIINRFIPIIELKKDFEIENRYKEILYNLRNSLNKNAWDGRWYKRAFMDTGETLGSIENDECRIDGISQSWAVISGAGDNDKKYISMESLENHLVDRENRIIKLLDPPFDKGKLNPGYIKAYLPGVRENGGQYTHGAIWAIIAETILGFGDKAVELFKMVNPIEHSRTKEAADKYKVEPYVIAADIYGRDNLAGRGGWTWYTGSASWIYKAGIEYILGLKVINNELIIKPCIPNEWTEYSIRYRYGESIYNIKVKRKDKDEIIFNNVKTDKIILDPMSGTNNVEVYIKY